MLSKVRAAGFTCFITQLSGTTESTIPATSTKKSDDVIAKEVVWGKWGNGAERVRRLREAGYDPSVIQAKVNVLMGK